jgi:hypothetical protein
MFIVIAAAGIIVFIARSIPKADNQRLLSTEISLDSIWSLGPTVTFYNKKTQKYYWLKSYTSMNQSKFDTLKSRKALVRYMKFLTGPFENRIFRMEVDSIVVFDQVIENN